MVCLDGLPDQGRGPAPQRDGQSGWLAAPPAAGAGARRGAHTIRNVLAKVGKPGPAWTAS